MLLCQLLSLQFLVQTSLLLDVDVLPISCGNVIKRIRSILIWLLAEDLVTRVLTIDGIIEMTIEAFRVLIIG